MPSVTPKNAEPPLVLAIDVGTTSVRAVLFDRRARDVRGVSASAETPLQTTSDGAASNGGNAKPSVSTRAQMAPTPPAKATVQTPTVMTIPARHTSISAPESTKGSARRSSR